MQTAEFPHDEAERLKALLALDVLDSAPEKQFDALTAVASMVCGAPVSLISLVDADRQWFKSAVGLPGVTETPRDVAFCAHAIRTPDLLVVRDAQTDPRFANNPLVTGAPDIRFYAGAPLELSNGARVGTLCVIDRVARDLTVQQAEVLKQLAIAAAHALETRRALQAEARASEQLRAAAEALADSETRLRVLSDSSPIGVYATDAQGGCTYTNVRWQHIYGLRPEEALGSGWAASLHADDRDMVYSEWQRCADRRIEFALEFRIRHRDGSVRHVHSRARPMLDAGGEILGFVGSVEDVSERRAMLDRVRAGEARIKRLYEHTPAMLQYTDADGRLLSVSQRWLDRLGYTREEALGYCWKDFLTAASRKRVDEQVRPAFLVEGRADRVECQIFAKSGDLVDVELSALLERDGAGQAYRVMAVLEDVTEQRRAQRALADERERLANLIAATHVGTWERNLQTGEVRCNERWAQIMGYELAELGALTRELWLRNAHPDDLKRSEALMALHLDGVAPFYECEVRMRHRNGHWVWALNRGKVLTWSADGRPEWMFGTLQDIDERKREEEERRRNENFLHRTGQLAGVGGWEVELPSRRITWSDATPHILGAPPGHVPSAAEALAYFEPEARAAIEAVIRQGIERNQGWDIELPLVRADGQRVWVRFVGAPELENGRAVRLAGAFQDIDERVRARQQLQTAHERMALATDSGGIGVWDFHVASASWLWDSWMWRLHGGMRDAGAPTREDWMSRIHPEDRQSVALGLADAMGGLQPFDTEFRVVWPDGSLHHLRATARVSLADDGEPVRVTGVCWDVTQARQLQRELAEQHELLHVTLQSIGDAVITTDAEGCVNWLNPAAERLTGWISAEVSGRPLPQVFHAVHEGDRKPIHDPVAACMRQRQPTLPGRHTLLLSRNGDEFGIEESAAPICNAAGELLGAVLVFRDVTEQRRLTGEMSYRAMHDALTGLVNRSEFEARLRRTLTRAQEEGTQHALLYIDLDQFKLVNDACGHAVGDQLLQQVARLLADTLRTRDTLARLGGDEFAAILEHCTIEQAQRVAEKVCDRMESSRFVHDGRRFRIGSSIGLVPVDARWPGSAAILQAADTSCYAAKEAGRNRVHVWFDTDDAMHLRHGQMRWASRIEQALDEDRLELHYQRIASIDGNDEGLHAEVLVRLREPDGTLVLPGAFLPAAERFHLASRIDRWVLRRATEWLRAQAVPRQVSMLAVNLSGHSISDRAFQRQAVELLRDLEPDLLRRLCLEVTETAAVTNLADAASFVSQMRELGVSFALDDFGAGASSFGYLKSLDVDFIKIDGQFITNILESPLDRATVSCFVEVARVVGVRTVAEFVDRPEVLAELKLLGVDFAQGFLIHQPEPLEVVVPAPAPID